MKIARYRPDMDLTVLFTACNVAFAGNWAFNPQRTLVALEDGQVVGFVASWWDGQPIAWVDMLLVHPKYRNGRVGSELCLMVEALLLAEGAHVIRCVLDEDSTLARPLERAGYACIGTFTVLERHYK